MKAVNIMVGKIKTILEDEKYGFKGIIETEDKKEYSFNSWNWYDNEKRNIDDISVGNEVEFELKPPNKNGKCYPRLIRFIGEKIDFSFTKPKHSHGEFKDFVYVNTISLLPSFAHLVDGLSDSEYNKDSKLLYKEIASFYNTLNNDDFSFYLDDGVDVVRFPSRFSSKDGHKIYLYCTKNIKNNQPGKSKWFCDKIFCNNQIYGGSIFDIVNANWYDIQEDLKKLLPKPTDKVNDVVFNIEKRCAQKENSLIWLKKGCRSTKSEADHLYVPTGYKLEEKELYLYCSKHSGIKGYGWYYDCITYENAPLDVYDKKMWLELWAEFNWEDILPKMVSQTLEERWSFGKRNDYGILKNYLIYTFSRQYAKKEVGYSNDKKFAVFNTGLPDSNTYKYIYAFFEKIERDPSCEKDSLHNEPQYRFRSFVISGRGGDGKILNENIRPLPSPPKYFDARSSTVWELGFNDNNQVTTPEYDDKHILIQRCDRLPLDFYRAYEFESERLKNILESEADDAQKYKEIREFFMPIVEEKKDYEVTPVYQSLVAALDNVINAAIKRLSWNWRAVVPCYNPEREESCFLLPVSFCNQSKPNRAMIASAREVNGEMVYSIHTVISLEWAYLDARLVCRPESEWLAVDNIT